MVRNEPKLIGYYNHKMVFIFQAAFQFVLSFIELFIFIYLNGRARLSKSCLLISLVVLIFLEGHYSITIIKFAVLHVLSNHFLLIGLTGGMASGKSTCVKIIREEFPQIEIIDCDVISHQITKKGTAAFNQIITRFGTEILDESGEINRAKLGERVFSNVQERKALNRITNKYISIEILKQLIYLKLILWKKYVVLDAPLLIENGWPLMGLCSEIIVVYCNTEEQVRRSLLRDHHIDEAQIRARIASQMSTTKKLDMCTISWENSSNDTDLRDLIRNSFDRIIRKLN